MQQTAISWTDATWNPTFGCSKVSPGCAFCYAETIALKFGHSHSKWTPANEAENVQTKEHKLREPYKLKTPSRVFVNSMSDLFHPQVPDEYIRRVFAVMNDLPQHTFQVLTKRPERAAQWPGLWTPNIWMGTSVENNEVRRRIDTLRECPAAVRFLSVEPMLGAIPNLNLDGIGWVIVGGESGFHMKDHPERSMQHEWAREIRDACMSQSCAFFFKQSSGARTELGTALEHEDGTFWEWHQFPGSLTSPTQVGLPKPATVQSSLFSLPIAQ